MKHTNQLTKEQAAAYRKRWALVNEAEIVELRQTSPAEKFRQTAALMASVRVMGWEDSLKEDEEIVWARWQYLREQYNG